MKPISLLAFVLPAFTYGAAVLDTGDVEISANFNGILMGSGTNPWKLTVRDSVAQREYAGAKFNAGELDRALIQAAENARIDVPDDERYSFLGAIGDYVWILPEASDSNVITPGVSTETRAQAGWSGDGVGADFLVRGIPSATFTRNRINVTLANFAGPGDFFLYRTDGFGNPIISMRTDDGVGSGDFRFFNAATHTHFNWAFTQPGEYTIGLRASGTLASSNTYTESDITTFRFSIVPEPSSALLLLLSAAALGSRRKRVDLN
jgi:surface-anchored protein